MTARLRVAFLGTPEVAVPLLRAVAERFDITVVVTQPDRPRGRSKRLQPPPVKTAALELSLPVAQPQRSAEIAGALGSAGPLDIGILVAYGRIVRPEALAVPLHGIVNAHFSLLPRWRGAAPVQRALLAGDARTGVSVMVLDPGLDTGPVLAMWSTAVGPSEDGGSLSTRLAIGAAQLLPEAVAAYVGGSLVATPQPDEGATVADKIGPGDRPIDWTLPAGEVANRIRALSPAPGATARAGDVPLKVLAGGVVDASDEPGRLMVDGGSVVVACGSAGIRLEVVQPAGGRAMEARDWLRGLRSVPDRVG
jgi:methionyl-tRNA formyltransferase